MNNRKICAILISLVILFYFTLRGNDVGTVSNPLIIEMLTPIPLSAAVGHIEKISKFIEKESGLKTALYAPKKSIEYIRALSGSDRKADVAVLNDIGYLFANDEYGATAELIVIRQSDGKDETVYCPAIVSVSLRSLEELNGHSIAFSDEYSTAGYLIPYYTLKEKGIKPSKKVFAGGYIAALRLLLSGKVDAAVIYTSCNSMNNELDSRTLVVNESPDVFSRTSVIYRAAPLPNEPVVFRKGLPAKVREKVIASFLKCPENQECRDALRALNGVTGFRKTDGSEYNSLREIIRSLEKDTADLIPGGWILKIRNSPELPRTGN